MPTDICPIPGSATSTANTGRRNAKLSLFDSACLIGDSIQGVCRTFDRKIFRWPDHRDRMYRSLKAARINFDMTPEELDRITHEFLERNLPALAAGDEAGVGHLASRGVLPLVLPATSMTFAMTFSLFRRV